MKIGSPSRLGQPKLQGGEQGTTSKSASKEGGVKMLGSRRVWICAAACMAMAAGNMFANAADTEPAGAGQSQPQGGSSRASAEAGQQLAEAFCSNCHLLGGETGAPVVVGIPSLKFIANRPGQTGERIESILVKPHAPMPDMKLSYPEIRDLLAYLETLRTDKSGPSLLPPLPYKDNPKLPSPG